MDRTPFKELTGDNVVNLCDSQEFDKFNGSPMSRPRISIIKAFDPLYESPFKCVLSQNVLNRTVDKNEASQVTNISNSNIIEIDDDDSFNNENYNPASTEKLNLSSICEKSFISDVQEFTEGIIMEAISRIFPEESVIHLNDTFYETADAAILDITRSVADDSTIHNESNICVSDQITENSFISCVHDIEINDLKTSVLKLESMCKIKDERIDKLKESNSAAEIEHFKQLNTLKENYNKQLEKITELESSCRKKDETISKLQEENETIRMQKDQSHAGNLETSAEKDEYIAQLEKTLAEREKDFSAAMSSLEQHIESQLNEIKTLQHENILAKRHLSSLEIVFADVHKKYERSKAVIQGYKDNEDALQNTLHIFEDNLKKYDQQIKLIKSRAGEEVNRSHRELLEVKEKYHVEITKLMSKAKHLEIKNSSLASALEQKIKECAELTNLCEEVTNKGFYN